MLCGELIERRRTLSAVETVINGRKATEDILNGRDDRLMVVVGYVYRSTTCSLCDSLPVRPCSVNNVESALEYAHKLKAYADGAKNDLHIVMRVYFEKPRTTVGWKGLINDPDMDGSFRINKGLRMARSLLLDVAKLGLPAGCEFLDTITPQYTADLVAWGAIGARTTESQVHRELTSALSMPTGFKNSTDGTVGIAVDACRAARSGHVFLSVGKEGLSSIVETEVCRKLPFIANDLSNEFGREIPMSILSSGVAQKGRITRPNMSETARRSFKRPDCHKK